MSKEYISALVLILVAILPRLGIQIGTEELTVWLQAIITVIGGGYLMYKRFKKGGITLVGVKKA